MLCFGGGKLSDLSCALEDSHKCSHAVPDKIILSIMTHELDIVINLFP